MKTTARTFGVGLTLALVGGSYLALAQQPPAAPPPPMSFFVTSAGSGNGANLGGLAGADQHLPDARDGGRRRARRGTRI